jgi:hypothetical protein
MLNERKQKKSNIPYFPSFRKSHEDSRVFFHFVLASWLVFCRHIRMVQECSSNALETTLQGQCAMHGLKKFEEISESDKQKITKYFFEFCNEFESMFNVEVFLCGGTFLGALRDKDFIPYDDDIDIHYFVGESSIKYINKFCSKICKKYNSLGRLRQHIKSCHYHVWFEDNVHFADVFPAWTEKGIFRCGGMGNRVCDGLVSEDVLPLKKIEFRNFNFKIPNNPEKFAEWMWGETWKIPKSTNKRIGHTDYIL